MNYERLSIDSPPSRMALYRSMVQSTLLYAAEIWGLLQGDIVEKNLVQFHKNLYFLPRSTPGYVIQSGESNHYSFRASVEVVFEDHSYGRLQAS